MRTKIYSPNFSARLRFNLRVPALLSHPDAFFNGWMPIFQQTMTRELAQVKERWKQRVPMGDSADHWLQMATAQRQMHGMTAASYDRWAQYQQRLGSASLQHGRANTHIRDSIFFSTVSSNPFNQTIQMGFASNIFFKAFVHAYRGTSVMPGKSQLRQRVNYQRPSPGANGRMRERRLTAPKAALTFPIQKNGVWQMARFERPVYPGSHRFASQRHPDWEINVAEWARQDFPAVQDNLADAWIDFLSRGNRLNRMPA